MHGERCGQADCWTGSWTPGQQQQELHFFIFQTSDVQKDCGATGFFTAQDKPWWLDLSHTNVFIAIENENSSFYVVLWRQLDKRILTFCWLFIFYIYKNVNVFFTINISEQQSGPVWSSVCDCFRIEGKERWSLSIGRIQRSLNPQSRPGLINHRMWVSATHHKTNTSLTILHRMLHKTGLSYINEQDEITNMWQNTNFCNCHCFW